MEPLPAPLCVVGSYELHPLRVCSEDAIAALFTKICERGNPILQGKPQEDLHRLGIAMYRKSSPYLMCLVCLCGGEPVALMMGWDLADGGVWAGTSAQPPASLAGHSAVGGACLASWPSPHRLPEQRGETWFGAFSGVALPHPGQIMAIMGSVSTPVSASAGFARRFSYVVHPALLAIQEQNPNWRSFAGSSGASTGTWRVTFSEIAADSAVKTELASLKPGYTQCSILDIKEANENADGAADKSDIPAEMLPFVEISRAVGPRICAWGSEEYRRQQPPVFALPSAPSFMQAAKTGTAPAKL